MRKGKIYLLMLLLLAGGGSAIGQDINFSQFYELPLLRNPALAGIFSGDIRATAVYRNQWESVTVPYRTFGLGLEYKKSMGMNSDDFVTLGLQATNDVAGDSKLSRTQLLPVINYHKSINAGGYLSAGIMGGAVFQRFDPSKLSFDDQFVNGAYSSANPTRQVFKNTSHVYWDISAGLSFSNVAANDIHYYIGAALFHIARPKVAFSPQYDILLNRKLMANAGLSVPLSDINKLIIYADYFMQGGNRQGQGGFMISHDLSQFEDEKVALSGGLFYRFKDALVPMVKLDYYHMSVGMSYDVNSSKLKTASQYRGGLEVTLSYKSFFNNYNSSANKVKCPLFY